MRALLSRGLLLIACVVGAFLASSLSIADEPARFALLIGNQGYTAKVGSLTNPHNDVALLKETLTKLGFKVTAVLDADYRTIDAAIKRHVATVRRAGSGAVSLVYYSGHGAADPDTKINYLIPVDVANADDEDLWNYSLNLNTVVEGLRSQAPAATHYVVFDACRNELNLTRKGKKALSDKGFVPIPYTPGVLVAYATAPGRTASDVGTGSGTYARALADEIVKPGVDSMLVFSRVARRVMSEIGQDPFLSASTMPEIFFAADAKQPLIVTPSEPTRAEVAQFCQSVGTNPSASVVRSLLEQYRGTPFAACIEARLVELSTRVLPKAGDQVAIVAPPPAAPPVPAPARCSGVDVEVAGQGKTCLDPADASKREFSDCSGSGGGRVCGPQMVVVPAGRFTMGSPASEKGREGGEGPQHEVTIAKPFAVGKFEVTFAEWDACVADGGCKTKPDDRGWGRGKRPVINVSWNDVTGEYLPWLNRKLGLSGAGAYRLLTEAEWEYAARGGTTTPFSTGPTITTDQANFDGNATYGGSAKGTYRQKTVDIGSFKANTWGLHDMHGNVWEWVQDCYVDSYTGAPTDSSAMPDKADCKRVLRGGSWNYNPRNLRAALRYRYAPDYRNLNVGFRVGRSVSR